MNKSYLLFTAAFTAPLVFRALVFRGRKLREPEQILDELKLLPCAIEDESEMWNLDKDSQFWKEISGMRGLFRIRRKAEHLKDFVRSLQLSREDEDEMQFISHRCYWITILVFIQLLILPFSTPHFLARWAAGLYSEVRTRSLTLCGEYNQDLYISLRVFS